MYPLKMVLLTHYRLRKLIVVCNGLRQAQSDKKVKKWFYFLTRTYFPEGTNGKLECEGKLICNTIELPWKMNETKVSCIPKGNILLESDTVRNTNGIWN